MSRQMHTDTCDHAQTQQFWHKDICSLLSNGMNIIPKTFYNTQNKLTLPSIQADKQKDDKDKSLPFTPLRKFFSQWEDYNAWVITLLQQNACPNTHIISMHIPQEQNSTVHSCNKAPTLQSSNPNRSGLIQTHSIALITCQRNRDTINQGALTSPKCKPMVTQDQ